MKVFVLVSLILLLLLSSSQAQGIDPRNLIRAAQLLGEGIANTSYILGHQVHPAASELQSSLQRLSIHNLTSVSLAAKALEEQITLSNEPKLSSFAAQLALVLNTLSHSLTNLNRVDPNTQMRKIGDAFVLAAASLSKVSSLYPSINADFIRVQRSCEEIILVLQRHSSFDTYMFVCIGLFTVIYATVCYFKNLIYTMDVSVTGYAVLVVTSFFFPSQIAPWYFFIYTIFLALGWRELYPRTSVAFAISLGGLIYWLHSTPPVVQNIFYIQDAIQMPCYYPEQLMKFEETSNGTTITLDSNVLDLLARYPAPYYIHTSAGLFRSGKSTTSTLFMRSSFLNSSCDASFAVCHEFHACTEGIWVWPMDVKHLNPSVIPRTMQSNGTLFIVDTEGIANPNSPQKLHLVEKLFTVATLLSSSLTIHTFRQFDTNELHQLTAMGTLAKALGMSAIENQDSARIDEQISDMLPNLNVLVTSAELYGKDLDISAKLEAILSNEHLKEMKSTLQHLFPKRKMYGGEPATKEEKEKLKKLNTEVGIPDGPFSNSVIEIWKRILADTRAKRFAGMQLDGERLKSMVTILHKIVLGGGCRGGEGILSVEAIIGCFDQLAWNEIEQIVQKAKKSLVFKLENGLVDEIGLLEARKAVNNACDKELQSLKLRLPSNSDTVINSLRQKVADLVEKTFVELHKIWKDMNTFVWQKGKCGPCTCKGMECIVECKRVYKYTTVPPQNCKAKDRPESHSTCKATDKFLWEYGDWKACSGKCPGTQTRDILCKNCGSLEHDTECNEKTRPSPQTRNCSLWTYSWVSQAWSKCSKECGGGTHERVIECKRCDGVVVSEQECSKLPIPSQVESCNEHTCGWWWILLYGIIGIVFVVVVKLAASGANRS